MSSRRLPGKALISIGHRPLLGRVIDNARLIYNVEKIVVATSDSVEDDAIADFCTQEGVGVFRGSLNNVTKRALNACQTDDFDGFVRICGDRPFSDINLTCRMIDHYTSGKFDLVTTIGKHNSISGLTCEVVNPASLKAYLRFFNQSHKEHVTSYFYENPDQITIKTIDPKYTETNSRVHLAVDTFEDLTRIRRLINTIDPLNKGGFSIQELIKAAEH